MRFTNDLKPSPYFSLLLIGLALMLTGCPPPYAARLLGTDETQPRHRELAERGREFYFIYTYYTAESLTERLTFPDIDYITIRLIDGTSVRADSARLNQGHLIYYRRYASYVVPLSEVNRIVIVDKLEPQILRTELSYTVPVYGTIGGITGGRIGEPTRMSGIGIGLLAGAAFGTWVGYGQANSKRATETIVINGYDLIQP